MELDLLIFACAILRGNSFRNSSKEDTLQVNEGVHSQWNHSGGLNITSKGRRSGCNDVSGLTTLANRLTSAFHFARL